jgi:hypothetical protein
VETQRNDHPLGLTVHSLPQLNSNTVQTAGNSRSAQIKLFLLFLVSAAPVIASYFTYYVIRPEGRRNYGELIHPQKTMPTGVQGVSMSGDTLPLENLRHQWLLITVADSACDAVCERNLYLSRQLREGLGKDKDRLDWVWLRTGDAVVPSTLLAAVSSAQVLRVDESVIGAWLQPNSGQRLSDHLYLVDPLGNWMMRFPVNPDASQVRKDLERLMRASNSWDQAGRPS